MFLVALGTEITVFLPAVFIKTSSVTKHGNWQSESVQAALFVFITCLFSSVILKASSASCRLWLILILKLRVTGIERPSRITHSLELTGYACV